MLSRNLLSLCVMVGLSMVFVSGVPHRGYYEYSDSDEEDEPVQVIYFRSGPVDVSNSDSAESFEEVEARVEEVQFPSSSENRRARIFLPFTPGPWGQMWSGTPYGYGTNTYGHGSGHSLTGFHHSHQGHYEKMYHKGHNQPHPTYFHNGFYTEVHKK